MPEPDPDSICVWPLRTPPTPEEIERINCLFWHIDRKLTPDEVLALMIPQGSA